jgi:Ca2+-transporting ATPase
MTHEGGLSAIEVRARLERDGPNRMPASPRQTWFSALLSVSGQPMVLLLLACTLLYAFLGNTLDAAVLGASIVGVAAIAVYQELRAQRVLEALRELASPRSSVVRDGIVTRISSRDLVEDDRLIVQEGDRLACDARLIEAQGLSVDESLLTGESTPVAKDPRESSDSDRMLRAGTLVVQGDGVAEVTATGERTTLGRIGRVLASIESRPSRLHQELTGLVRMVAFVAVFTCLAAASLFAWREGSWTAGLLVGLTLAMSIIPEEFAVVWSVMLALGAWRLTASRVLTRQPQAIEALGATTVLCVDKTGTLTVNRMEVAALSDGERDAAPNGAEPLDGRLQMLLRSAAMASVRAGIEPMDNAIHRLLDAQRVIAPAGEVRWREGVIPGRPYVSQGWCLEGEQGTAIAIKGAAEAVLARCVDPAERLRALALQADAWAAEGRRVIAVAVAHGDEGASRPASGWRAVGLVAFADPLRSDVPQAVAECRRAGIRVVMVTGDGAATALAIARRAGLVGAGEGAALTGAELDAMSEAQCEQAVATVSVFARVVPTQKLRIVQALQRRGEVVAMTGDGVNDGPALRAADVGVAMGQRGTDVAREAAAIVLLDDRFPSLVEAVRAGRRIFENLRKAMGYLFAVHVPIVGLSLLPLFGGPVLLLPIHVVLLELIIDPACSLVFEAEPARSDTMSTPPRSAATRLFDVAAVARALLAGGVALVAVVLVQGVARAASFSDEALRLAGLATIVVGNLALLQWFRGAARGAGERNRAFHWLVLAVCVLAGLVLLIEPLRRTFGLPSDIDPRLVLILLAIPCAHAAWRLRPASVDRVIEEPGQRTEDQQDDRRDGARKEREEGDGSPAHGRDSTDAAPALVDLDQPGGVSARGESSR